MCHAIHVQSALKAFGFGALSITNEDLLDPHGVIQLGYPPMRIDLLNGISGVEFETA